MNNIDINEYRSQFDTLVRLCVQWLVNRRRYRMTKIIVIDTIQERSNYAEFKANRSLSQIILYKRHMIDFYINNSVANSKTFKAFFISTIAHELVHRHQWIVRNRDYNAYLSEYRKNKQQLENEAVMIEKRIWKHFE